MTEAASESVHQVAVPDLVGLTWFDARRTGEEAGLWVSGPDPDGPPLAAVGWPGGVVVKQQPAPGTMASTRSELIVWVERTVDAGDREPRRPVPPAQQFAAEPEE